MGLAAVTVGYNTTALTKLIMRPLNKKKLGEDHKYKCWVTEVKNIIAYYILIDNDIAL